MQMLVNHSAIEDLFVFTDDPYSEIIDQFASDMFPTCADGKDTPYTR